MILKEFVRNGFTKFSTQISIHFAISYEEANLGLTEAIF